MRKGPLPRAKDNARKVRTLEEMKEANRAAAVAKLAAKGLVTELAASKAKGTAARVAATSAERRNAVLERKLAEKEAAEAQARLEAPVKPERQRRTLATVDAPTEQTGMGTQSATRSARAAMYQAFDDMGGVRALVMWGKKNPAKFYPLWARLIPIEVEDETKKLPLETLLEKLAARADQDIETAAREIGMEALEEAGRDIDMVAVAALYDGETIN